MLSSLCLEFLSAKGFLSFPQIPGSLGRFSAVYLAPRACLYCPWCLFLPILPFYSFLLNAVLLSCMLNCVIVYIRWQKRQKLLSFSHKSSPRRKLRSARQLHSIIRTQSPRTWLPPSRSSHLSCRPGGGSQNRERHLSRDPLNSLLKSLTQHFTQNSPTRNVTCHI